MTWPYLEIWDLNKPKQCRQKTRHASNRKMQMIWFQMSDPFTFVSLHRLVYSDKLHKGNSLAL